MALRTAPAGSSNWTAAAFGGGAATVAADEVIIPTGSTVTITAANTVLCRSLSVTGTGTLIFAAATSIVTIGDATAGTGNVALSIANTATITLTASDGVINFISTSATQQTITSGGKTLPTITINGAGSSYILGDALTQVVTGVVTTFNLFAGTFNTGNYNMTTLIWNVATAGTKTLTLGSSAITVARNATAIQVDPTGLTVTANTAVITCTAQATVSMTNTNMNGASLVFTSNGNATMQNGGTWANVTRTGTANKTDTLIVSVTGFTVTGTLTLTANSDINRIFVNSNVRGSSRTITAANVVITNTVDFMDVDAAGAATWTVAGTGATYLGDAGGNTGITFSTPVTQTATGTASFTWSTHGWTSRVPLPQDDVVINNAFVAGRTVTMDMPRAGKNIDFSGSTGAPIINQSITIDLFGSLAYASNNVPSGGTMTFSGRGTNTITTNGVTGAGNWTFNCPGGTYTLQDNLMLPATSTIFHLFGTLNTNSKAVSTGVVSGSGSTVRSLILGTTTLSLTATAASIIFQYTVATNLTMSAASSTIIIASASANTRTFAGGGQTYGTLSYIIAASSGQLTVSGANTFSNIEFQPNGTARTIVFPNGVTNTITTGAGWKVFGTVGQLATVTSASAGSAFTLAVPTGIVSSDYLSLKDSTASGATPFYAGANSTNVSGNTNWLFTAAPSLSNGNFLMFM